MSWDKLAHDFGEVAPRSKNKVIFEYTGPLTIVGVKGSCGCTTTKNDDNTVTAVLTSPHCKVFPCSKHVKVTVTLQDPVTKQTTRQVLKVTAKSVKQ